MMAKPLKTTVATAKPKKKKGKKPRYNLHQRMITAWDSIWVFLIDHLDQVETAIVSAVLFAILHYRTIGTVIAGGVFLMLFFVPEGMFFGLLLLLVGAVSLIALSLWHGGTSS